MSAVFAVYAIVAVTWFLIALVMYGLTVWVTESSPYSLPEDETDRAMHARAVLAAPAWPVLILWLFLRALTEARSDA